MFAKIFLAVVVIGFIVYIWKYGFSKKKTGSAIVSDKGQMDAHGNVSVQSVQKPSFGGKPAETLLRITVIVENQKVPLDLTQADYHKYNLGSRIAVEYRVNKKGTVTSVTLLPKVEVKPIKIKINEKPTTDKYNHTTSDKNYWT